MRKVRLLRAFHAWVSGRESDGEGHRGPTTLVGTPAVNSAPEAIDCLRSPRADELREIGVGNVQFVVGRTPVDFSGFWSRVASQAWEPETFALMDRLLVPGALFIDIGAWIGPTSLYAAALGCQVEAYECDPIALACLHTNLALNPALASRITVHEAAIGESDGQAELWSHALGNSESSFLARHERDSIVTTCGEKTMVETCDALRVFRERDYAGQDTALIKIDIEGAEFAVIPRLAPLIPESRAIWYVSFHELNLNPKNLPVDTVRVAEMLRVLICFGDLHWYSAELVELDKGATLRAIMSQSWPPHGSLVFSSRRLNR